MTMLLLFCLAIISALSQGSVWDNLTVNIAVVEYKYKVNVQSNTEEYTKLISSLTSDSKIDMIIFPEDTLRNSPYSAVDVNVNTICDNTTKCDTPLDQIALAARKAQTYVVINLVEQSKCESSDQSSNCRKYSRHFYNTDVVFDRQGRIINKYRKYNLFGEYSLDQPETPDKIIIHTDFGANFGIFTCFDILFKSPAQDLLSDNIDGVIFPTMWFSELPFLTAVQTQQMWAETHDVALFAAGANNPERGSGGSGAYRGTKGLVLGGYVAEGGTETYVYRSVNGTVPSSPSENTDVLAKDMDNFHLLRDASVDEYSSEILDTSKTDIQTELCHGNTSQDKFCCKFSVKISKETPKSNLNFYTYHMVAYSGVRSFSGVYNGGIEICGVIACLNSSLSSCGRRFSNYDDVQWPVIFKELSITADFDENENKTQFPNSLLSSIRPIETDKTLWSREENGGKIKRTFKITEEQNRILTFAIFGRDFMRDSDPNKDNGNNSGDGVSGGTFGLLLGCWIFLGVFAKLG